MRELVNRIFGPDGIGIDECGLILGLVLVGIGGWYAWRPLAGLVPGLILLWIFLPARLPFVLRQPDPRKESH